jgi:hypothetical protein
LVVNRDLLALGEKAIRSADPGSVGKRLRCLNPNYWPKPQSITKGGGGVELMGIHGGFLAKDDYGRAIGTTSEWLHWRNPYKSPLDLEVGYADLTDLFQRIELLIRVFTMTLPNDSDLLLLSMNAGRPGARDLDTAPGVVNLSRVGDLPA